MNKVTFEQYWAAGRNLLKFFNLLDQEGHLSISNVAVIICITKMAIAPQVTIVDAGALLLTLLNYMHKRTTSTQAAEGSLADDKATSALTAVEAVKVEVEGLKALHDTVVKQAEETRKALSNANIISAFGVKR